MSSILGEVTNRQSDILAFCTERWEAGECLPSLREICAHFGYASTRAAADHLNALKAKGYLADDTQHKRGYRLTEKATGLPVLGGIQAGIPMLTEECVESHFAVNIRSFGIANRRNAFLLRVCGNSMTGRHIFDGDIALVEKCSHFKNEDVVAALIDNESTLKTFIKNKGGRAWLRSENPQYPDLIPAWDLQVQGVVRGVIRLFPS
ncbi:transcriptional repressor LexA [Pseudohongiella nitratireducens]|uniref:transcriptional repressor LexA n=1 Tax=Pseudohongiella nitratireducens TaxID=1768907 RepID=UPI0030EE15E3|tara:strand:+ start:3945 stop:4562 length:618 start_codon:yes stop_codon:yes gene_type:complete